MDYKYPIEIKASNKKALISKLIKITELLQEGEEIDKEIEKILKD